MLSQTPLRQNDDRLHAQTHAESGDTHTHTRSSAGVTSGINGATFPDNGAHVAIGFSVPAWPFEKRVATHKGIHTHSNEKVRASFESHTQEGKRIVASVQEATTVRPFILTTRGYPVQVW